MGLEIERKFLVKDDFIPSSNTQIKIEQAYLSSTSETTVRIRIADLKAFITIKGKTTGISRLEYEYEIPFADAQEMIKLSLSTPIKKVRHIIQYKNKKWEVDVFQGENEGLILAECELNSEDETINLPDWVKQEVSGNQKYSNSNLSKEPFKYW